MGIQEDLLNNAKEMTENYPKKKSTVIVLGKHIENKPNEIMKSFMFVLGEMSMDEERIKPATLESIRCEDTLRFETPRQKAHSLFSNSRFVVIENMCPAGQIVELEYCRNVGVMTAVVCKKDCRQSSWMTLDFPIHSKDIHVFYFDKEDLNNVRKTAKEIIAWVKERGEQRYSDFKDAEKKFNQSERFLRI